MKNDPALATVIASWPTLPTALRRAVLAVIQTAEPAGQEWLTVSEAARLLQTDIDGLEFANAAGRISQAIRSRRFTVEGTNSRRRIDPTSFAAWRLQQRERNLARSDGAT